MKNWDFETDVMVVGSGGGAFTAAILSHDHGARVVILERTDKVGGTTSVSGGAFWIPMNTHMKDLGVEDSREEALAYCKALSDGRVDEKLIETFVDNGYKALEYLEKNTPVVYEVMTMPDYHPEFEGAKRKGRSIEPGIYDLSKASPPIGRGFDLAPTGGLVPDLRSERRDEARRNAVSSG
jgi:succinate dehydrogenase/fumarate reductase flavoprotein subunit